MLKKFHIGRCFGSKSTYRRAHPNNLILFNANVLTDSGLKIWHGDLDLTVDYKDLIEEAKILNKDLYVLQEMDGRFGNENNPAFKEIAVWSTKLGLHPTYERFFDKDTLTS